MKKKPMRAGTLNMEHFGQKTDSKGNVNTDRFWSILGTLAKLDLDVLFLQEMTFRHRNGGRLRFAAENTLGMRSFLSPTPAHADGERVNPPGLFIRPGVFEIVGEWPQRRGWYTPPAAISVRYRNAPSTLQLASAHLSYQGPEMRTAEARMITTWQTQGQAVMAGMDGNSNLFSAVEHNPLPDWPNIPDTTHRAHRTRDGLTSDTTPHDILTAAGLHDAAEYAATHLGQANATAPTASMYAATNARQGPPQRIDCIKMSRALLPAIVQVEVIALEGTDHALVVADVDPDGLETGLHLHAEHDYRKPLWTPDAPPFRIGA
ncbi:hypothetical protein ACIHEI_34800 [Kitasatospora sp. NPDC051984]|uniref:hypothetical protein n=1 Tax=Kitasatospora sp. NPDC051984 TaxID=3364059 RepID=UPI0037C75FAA